VPGEIVADPALADELPIPHFFERRRPYITAGAIVAKDRRSGQTNLSIARLMPLGGNSAFVGIAPNHHLAVLARASACARRETRHRRLHRQSPGGAGRVLSLSRIGR
jgi:UbiD family decarboxylase